ncbi:MAG: NAD(P)/FAD-dependent oxidoreductase [Rhodopirellula sp.]|nr:NAD(P)/FAD-dependent oxidoreductase [Rhodopirellula sp.]
MADFKVTQIDENVDFDSLPWWDVVIIGAGPAGLAASLTTAHRALTTLVIEAKDSAGGQPQFLYADKKIVDVPGFPDGVTGHELSERTFRQAVEAQVQFRFNEELKAIENTDQVVDGDSLKQVVTSNGSYLCRKVILACGLLHYPRRHSVLDALNSDAVHYRSPRVADYEGSTVIVVGGGDSALDAAVMALQRGARVEVIVRKVTSGKADTLNLIRELGGVIRTSTEITQATLKDGVISAVLSDGTTIDCEHAVVQIGFLSAKETFEGLGLKLNDEGAVAIDPYFETSRHGIFAVGDVHGDIKLIAVAWAEGIQAAIHAFHEITSPYWLNEKRLHDNKLTLIAERLSQAAVQKRE